MSAAKLKLEVRSRREPVRHLLVQRPVYAQSGVFLGMATSRVVVYESSLDSQSERLVAEAGRLSADLGLDLEVVDRSSRGIMGVAKGLFRASRPG